jgi:hypothetical protein
VVEVRLVHGYESSGGSRTIDECHECESVRIDDPLGRVQMILVSKEPDLRITSGAMRAILAYEVDAGPAPRSSPLFRVTLVVDRATKIALTKLRAEPEFEYAVVTVDGRHRSLGELRGWSQWELDIGFFRKRDEISKVFSEAFPPVHLVRPLDDAPDEAADQGSAGSESSAVAAPRPSESSSSDEGALWAEGPAVWAQGPIRNGARHGVWLFFDYTGEVVRLEALQNGRLLETIEPWRHPDTRQLKELMKEP